MKLKLMIKSCVGLIFLFVSFELSSGEMKLSAPDEQWLNFIQHPWNTHEKPALPVEEIDYAFFKQLKLYKEQSRNIQQQKLKKRRRSSAFSSFEKMRHITFPEKIQFQTDYSPEKQGDIDSSCYGKNEDSDRKKLKSQGLPPSQKWWEFHIIHPWSFRDIDPNPNCYRKNEKTYCKQLKEKGVFSENIECNSLVKAVTNKDYQKPCDDPEIITDLNYCDVIKKSLAHTQFANLKCKSDSCEALRAKTIILKAAFEYNSCYRMNNNSKNLCEDLQKEFKYTKSTHDNICSGGTTRLMDETHRTDCEFLMKNNEEDMYETVCGNCFYKVCFALWKNVPFDVINSSSSIPSPEIHSDCVRIQPPKTITMEDIQSEAPFSVSYFYNSYFWSNYGYLSDPDRKTTYESFKENFPFLNPPYHSLDTERSLASN